MTFFFALKSYYRTVLVLLLNISTRLQGWFILNWRLQYKLKMLYSELGDQQVAPPTYSSIWHQTYCDQTNTTLLINHVKKINLLGARTYCNLAMSQTSSGNLYSIDSIQEAIKIYFSMFLINLSLFYSHNNLN